MRILTVDVEDWFHILDNESTQTEHEWASFPSRLEEGVGRLLDLFDRHDQKATCFILGWVAREHPEVAAEIKRRGHEIATHSDMHQLVYQQSPEAFEQDLVTSIEAIVTATGVRPTAYRAPGFSLVQSTAWAFEILARNGITTDCSVFPAPRAHGGIPGFPESGPCTLQTASGARLRAFPINLGRIGGRKFVFSGGGYFRLAPAPLLRRWFRQSDYVMTYFHPRDFDPEQPMVPGLSRLRRFKSYVGLRGALAKLDSLLGAHRFLTLGEAEATVKWEEAPLVEIA